MTTAERHERRAADEAALRHHVGAVWLARDAVQVSGPEALSFLQGQLSQDVARLAEGESAWSFLLQPQGKVDALVRVTRTGGDELVLDTDGGWGQAVLDRLRRFKLRVKVELTLLDWRCLALRGPQAGEPAAAEAGGAVRAGGAGGEAGREADGVLVLPADWPGWPGVDLLGLRPPLPDGVRLCERDAYETLRIEAGVPAMGAELDERTIPEETGLVDRTVSFTKGCFTGQELVARIDARGANVPRRLRGVVATRLGALPPVGAAVDLGGREVGRLTSVASSLERGTGVALAYVRREVEPPAEAVLRWAADSVPAHVHALPLPSASAPG